MPMSRCRVMNTLSPTAEDEPKRSVMLLAPTSSHLHDPKATSSVQTESKDCRHGEGAPQHRQLLHTAQGKKLYCQLNINTNKNDPCAQAGGPPPAWRLSSPAPCLPAGLQEPGRAALTTYVRQACCSQHDGARETLSHRRCAP